MPTCKLVSQLMILIYIWDEPSFIIIRYPLVKTHGLRYPSLWAIMDVFARRSIIITCAVGEGSVSLNNTVRSIRAYLHHGSIILCSINRDASQGYVRSTLYCPGRWIWLYINVYWRLVWWMLHNNITHEKHPLSYSILIDRKLLRSQANRNAVQPQDIQPYVSEQPTVNNVTIEASKRLLNSQTAYTRMNSITEKKS